VEERALPDAGRSDHRHHFAAIEGKIEVFQDSQPGAPDGVALGEVGNFNKHLKFLIADF
jgi:hypothetical protein